MTIMEIGAAKRVPLTIDDLPELSTRQELHAFTGIGMSTLARWATEGKGPRVTKLSNRVRYRKADIIAYLDGAAVA